MKTPSSSWHAQTIETICNELQTNATNGLSEKEADLRLQQYGPNSLEESRPTSFLIIFARQFQSPLIYLLFASAVLIVFIGQKTDPLIVVGVALLNAIMGTIQEGRAERALHSLKKLGELKSRVIREGQEHVIQNSSLVPGDVIKLNAGDAVGADMRIIEAIRLQANEAPLTGESIAVAKQAGTLSEKTLLPDQTNMLFSGTYVVSGRALCVVTSTGKATEMGKIAELAQKTKTPKTPLEKKVDDLGKVLGLFAIFAALLMALAGAVYHFSTSEIILSAVALFVSVIPEGLPIAITIALAYGVQKMATRQAIVRQLSAVETLGSVTVICSDKTGTLTKNEMTVTEVILPSLHKISFFKDQIEMTKRQAGSFPELLELLHASILCNDASLQNGKSIGDPTEIALLTAAQKCGLDIEQVRREAPRTLEIPFDSESKMMATEHRSSCIYLKGALEKILECCLLSEENKKAALHLAEKMASEGLRILGFAKIAHQTIHPEMSFSQFQQRATFLGFVAQIDPPREEVIEAVQSCKSAGIRPVMITGDHLNTARAIASQIGILQPQDLSIDGRELEEMPLGELKKKIPWISVFARVYPGQKLKIVEALQEDGEIVAMTGDGSNDAPALVKADVGVSMGITGTDIAKESSNMILLDDNFATLVKAIEEGRVIFRNLQRLVYYLLSTSLAGAVLLIITILLGYPLPIHPLQLLWINVITEGTVGISLVMQEAEGHEMKSPPTSLQEKILSPAKIKSLILMALVLGFLLQGYFLYGHYHQKPLLQLQTETFTLFAFCAWLKALSCSSEKCFFSNLKLFRNSYMNYGLLTGIFLHLFVLYVPWMNHLFETKPLSLPTYLPLLGLALSFFLIEECKKKLLSH